MEFSTLDTIASAESGATLELEHPVTGEKLDATITLAGADSRVYRRALSEQSKRRNPRQRRTLSLEDAAADGIEILAACTLSWAGVELDGQPLPCTRENARTLYTRFPWVREQVDQFVADRSHYLSD